MKQRIQEKKNTSWGGETKRNSGFEFSLNL